MSTRHKNNLFWSKKTKECLEIYFLIVQIIYFTMGLIVFITA